MIAFKKVKDPYGWLGNMSPHPIGEFRTAEHLFQATRFKDCTNRQNESGLFWGAALKDGVWVGENQLGKFWMYLRDVV